MDAREARERRVWRLAWLLLGADADRAAAAAARVLAARTDLARLDPARLDRLCVLAARHVAARRPAATKPTEADPAHIALLRQAVALPRQCLEAWVLTRLEQLDPIRVARSMDCSRTAAQRHLERADELLREPLAALGLTGPEEDSLARVRCALDGLDAGPTIRRIRHRIRRRRRVRSALILLALALAATAVAYAILNA